MEQNNIVSILSIEGRQYPVDIQYLTEPSLNYLQTTIEAIISIHKFVKKRTDHWIQEKAGDVLVFLPGRDDIDFVIEAITDHFSLYPISTSLWFTSVKLKNIAIFPLYAGLSSEEQDEALLPLDKGIRKVIVSTNIAESSVTINNINFVVDCGFTKVSIFQKVSLW